MMNGGLSASDVAVLSGSNNRADEGYGNVVGCRCSAQTADEN